MRIKGNVAIVTGGASGLGEATARHLAEQGARVGVLDFDAEGAARVAAQIGGLAAPVDISDEGAVDAAIARINADLGTPRIAVNCAGIGTAARIVGREGKTSFDTFRRTLDVNLFGSYAVMTHAARRMMDLDPVEGERGVIVNTASVAFQDGQLGQAAYAASKGGIAAMTLPAAREFARAQIRVMTIAPGLFNTPMMESLPDEVTAQIVEGIPHPARLGAPGEYALMAAQIIENPYLNGTTIRLDGATRLPPR